MPVPHVSLIKRHFSGTEEQKKGAKLSLLLLHAVANPPYDAPPSFGFNEKVRAATLQKCGSENFPRFLCQRCRELWRKILVKFSVLRFPGFGCARENFTNTSRQKRCGKRKISRKFHSAGAPLKSQGKKGKTLKKARKFLVTSKEKSKEIQKARKGRSGFF